MGGRSVSNNIWEALFGYRRCLELCNNFRFCNKMTLLSIYNCGRVLNIGQNSCAVSAIYTNKALLHVSC